MVYIRGGSTTIKYNQSSTDSNSNKKVSLTSFFIDRTETTNQQYRLFTEWVIDSIAIVKYLKDEKYFLSNTVKGEADKPSTDASVVATTDSTGAVVEKPKADEAFKFADSAIMVANANDSSKRRIDWSKVDHDKIFRSKDKDVLEKIKPLLDENGNIRKDAYVFSYTYLKTVNVVGKKNKSRVYVTEPVSIYPDERVWAEDLTNSQTDLLVENYFKVHPYDDYPVVGVNWKQARAYSYWRSIRAGAYIGMPEYMKYYHLTYTLPSEAQWVYAASGFYDMIMSNDTGSTEAAATADSSFAGLKPTDSLAVPHDSAYIAAMMQPKTKDIVAAKVSDNVVVDSTPIHRDVKGMLDNFKQDEGDYWEDGAALTLPVMAYAPNEFGLYNMDGNVSEWMMDAYSPSTFSFVSDLNPVLLYDADSTDAEAMRRKVVRGGSFVSNATALSPYFRDLEIDTVAHCFLGFRCVMMAPEVLYLPVSTRKKRLVGNSPNKISPRTYAGQAKATGKKK